MRNYEKLMHRLSGMWFSQSEFELQPNLEIMLNKHELRMFVRKTGEYGRSFENCLYRLTPSIMARY